MTDARPTRTTALERVLAAHPGDGGRGLTVAEVRDRIIFRLEAAAPGGEAFGRPLPASGQVAPLEGGKMLALGPKTWLLVGAEGWDLQGSLGPVADTDLVEVGQAYALLRLGGPRARQVLSGLCPVDLHPESFPPGRCFASNLAGHNVLVEAEAAAFLLYLERSGAVSFWEALKDAAGI